MKSLYEAAEDDDLVDINLSLDIKCNTDDTLSVTSNDLELDPARKSKFCVQGILITHGYHCSHSTSLRRC